MMRIVNNGRYYDYFEVGRAELLRSLGISYAELEVLGIQLPLIESHCNYYSPAKYDDLLIVTSTIALEVSAKLPIHYRIERKQSIELLVDGYTIHAFVDSTMSRVIRPPKIFQQIIEKARLSVLEALQ